MQTASSRIWTLIVNSISYDDNHYTKMKYLIIILLIKIYKCMTNHQIDGMTKWGKTQIYNPVGKT